jgi:hypothetical protein
MQEKLISGQSYRLGKLTAFQQLHVSRKVGPLIPTLVPAFLAMGKQGAGLDQLGRLASLVQPFTEAFASMSDEDVEYVAGICLGVVQRQQGSTWAPIWNQQGKCLMFDDIDLGAMIPLVVQVIVANLGPFISGLLTAQTQPKETASA